jgi:porphobilinogen synthase
MRRLVSEVRPHPAQLVLPMFVADSPDPQPIASLPGVMRHSMDSLAAAAHDAASAGLGGIMLFGVPQPRDKDATGSAALDPNGILNRSLSRVASEVGDSIVIMADTCLDEFTDHGHCGVLTPGGRNGDHIVDNDATIELYARQAVAQAEAGAQVVSPSGMMDGQVAAIRAALDAAGHTDTAILSYAAKYASALYGPFREAVDSSFTGDRRTYQLDPANRRAGLLEARLDIDEGADLVMVKPAGLYLDVVSDVAAMSPVPVAAYQVSGEYAMIQAAAQRGWIDGPAAMREAITSIIRAGADVVLTYAAMEVAPTR